MNKMPDWLKSGLVTGIIFAAVTIFNSGVAGGRNDQAISELQGWKKDHSVWSDARNDELQKAKEEIAAFKAEIGNLKTAMNNLSFELKTFNAILVKKN